MCFGGGSKPSTPDTVPVVPPPSAPVAPAAPPPAPSAPQTLKVESQLGIIKKKSSQEESGNVSQGTSQFRIPLNVGTRKSGGLNV